MAFISETKILKERSVNRISKLQLPNFEIVPSRGSGGGLWLLWSDSVSVSILETSQFFIVAKFQINPSSPAWVLFAVYGDCEDRVNSFIWDRIEYYATDQTLPVCTIGDFNCISDIGEKVGGNPNLKTKHKKFRAFVQRSGLIDLGHWGPAYTWANNQQERNLIMERLDRGLCTADWLSIFPNTKIFHLPNYSSDDLPVLLRTEPCPKKGARPFRIEHWWYQHPHFKQICETSVQKGQQSWQASYTAFRNEIKNWSEGNKDPNWELKKIEKEMEKLVTAPQNQQVRDRIATLQSEYQKYIAAQETYWLQRSRLNWSLMGDQNTRFFHTTTMVRRRRNRVSAIRNQTGGWAVEEKEIRMEFINHFKRIFTQNQNEPGNEFNLPQEVLTEITPIPNEALMGLEQMPTESEIKSAAFALGPTKAPGPDGITASLIQQNWTAFGPVVNREVLNFFQTGVLAESTGNTHLVLIPKVKAPTMVSEFRPISICNFMYKVISKIIAKRMQPWMNGIIAHNQTAFVPGREISENIILLREILHTFKQPNRVEKQFVLKVDLAKAFDMLRWDYLFALLPVYGFPPSMCKWIEACIKSAKFTILFNGAGDGFLRPTRGLKQGCAMSPYLFILAMDPLARWLNLKIKQEALKGLKVAPTSQPLSCSMFADDLLLMGKLTNTEVESMAETLQSFCQASGMRINNSKSKVWFSNTVHVQEQPIFYQYFDVQPTAADENYLGCPVTITGSGSFDYLIQKFETRLNSWKARFLTHAGRLILLKAVLESMPVYAMGTVILPAKVITKLTAIMRNFFWGGDAEKKKLPYVAWEEISTPKGMGGLGLRSLAEMNKALVLKTVWKIANEVEALWTQALRAKYFPRSTFWNTNRTYNCSKLWRDIVHIKPALQFNIVWKVGSGERVKAFSQPWFPNWSQHRAATNQQREIRVSDLIQQETRTWDFEALQALFGFQEALNISLSEEIKLGAEEAPDTLIYTFAKTGKFTVSKAYQMLRGDTGNATDKAFWTWVWKNGGLIPKLKLFI